MVRRSSTTLKILMFFSSICFYKPPGDKVQTVTLASRRRLSEASLTADVYLTSHLTQDLLSCDMLFPRLSRIGIKIFRELYGGKFTVPLCRTGSALEHYSGCWRPQFELHPEARTFQSVIFQKHHQFTTTAAVSDAADGKKEKETISVTFVDKDGDEKQIEVPVGMSMLEAAHQNDIDLEGACEGSLACSTCHVIVMDMEHYNKLEDPTDEENDMLDLAFGLTETSRLGCQVIAKPELDGIRLALPVATRNFAVDGYVPKPH